jgi:hypothetical protein
VCRKYIQNKETANENFTCTISSRFAKMPRNRGTITSGQLKQPGAILEFSM